MNNNNKRTLPTISNNNFELPEKPIIEKRNNYDMITTQKTKKVLIALPHTGYFNWFTVAGFLGADLPSDWEIYWHFMGGCLIYEARDKAVEEMYKINADAIIFIDSDMVIPKDFFNRMLNQQIEKKDGTLIPVPILSGMAFKRYAPYQPCFYSTVDYDWDNQKPILTSPFEFPDKGLLRVEGAGAACLMIRREVFDIIPSPRFFPIPNFGEDLAFFLKVKQAKIPSFVDLELDIGHVSTAPVGLNNFKLAYNQWKDQHRDALMHWDKKIKQADKKDRPEIIKQYNEYMEKNSMVFGGKK